MTGVVNAGNLNVLMEKGGSYKDALTLVSDPETSEMMLAYTAYLTDKDELASFASTYLGYYLQMTIRGERPAKASDSPEYATYSKLRDLWVDIYDLVDEGGKGADAVMAFAVNHTYDLMRVASCNFGMDVMDPDKPMASKDMLLDFCDEVIMAADRFMSACEEIARKCVGLCERVMKGDELPDRREVYRCLSGMSIDLDDMRPIRKAVDNDSTGWVSRLITSMKKVYDHIKSEL